MSYLKSARGLPMILPIEETYVDGIPQAEDAKLVLKGDKAAISAKFGTEISRFKEHLQKIAK